MVVKNWVFKMSGCVGVTYGIIKRNKQFSTLHFWAWTNIRLFLHLIIISCVSYHKLTQGTMNLVFSTDSMSVISMKHLEAMYITNADLDATTDGHLNIIAGDKYIFMLHAIYPPPAMRIFPPETLVDYRLFIFLDSIGVNNSVELSRTKALFYHDEICNFNLTIKEIGSIVLKKFIIYRQMKDTILGYISFKGEVYDMNPRKYYEYKTSRKVEGQVCFKAVKTNLKKISSQLKEFWLPKGFLIDFLKE